VKHRAITWESDFAHAETYAGAAAGPLDFASSRLLEGVDGDSESDTADLLRGWGASTKPLTGVAERGLGADMGSGGDDIGGGHPEPLDRPFDGFHGTELRPQYHLLDDEQLVDVVLRADADENADGDAVAGETWPPAPAQLPPPVSTSTTLASALRRMIPRLPGQAAAPPVAPSRGGALSRAAQQARGKAAREYRRQVAIPRYLDKRSRRKWTQGLMHPSRSIAARRRMRNGGQFGVANTHFSPLTLRAEDDGELEAMDSDEDELLSEECDFEA
jgi:hypothetical protein